MSDGAIRRVVIKFSGEALGGNNGTGLDTSVLEYLAGEIVPLSEAGVEVALVVGGGNVVRGNELAARGFDRVSADHMGMLATMLNGIAVEQAIESAGVKSRVMSAIPVAGIVEEYDRRNAQHLLTSGYVLVFSGGLGNPFFTTDSAAMLRAVEIGADAMLKATKVDGVYDKDPMRDSTASIYTDIQIDKVIADELGVMDMTALYIARENQLPVHVFNMTTKGALAKIVLAAEPEGTRIYHDG